MLDFDGDGDINEFDEELTEYELQLVEDEMMVEEMDVRQYQEGGNEDDWGKSCGLGMLIGLGFLILIYSFSITYKNFKKIFY